MSKIEPRTETTTKMKTPIKRKWLKALRSGKYQQTTGTLKSDSGFCCLGVLRDVMHPRSRLDDPNDDVLHERHEKEAGLTRNVQELLAVMNDGNVLKGVRPHSFAEIADWIEKNL